MHFHNCTPSMATALAHPPDCTQDEWPGNLIHRPNLKHMYPPFLCTKTSQADFSISSSVKRHGKKMPRGRLVFNCTCKKVILVCWPNKTDSDEQILESLIMQFETKHGPCASLATPVTITNATDFNSQCPQKSTRGSHRHVNASNQVNHKRKNETSNMQLQNNSTCKRKSARTARAGKRRTQKMNDTIKEEDDMVCTPEQIEISESTHTTRSRLGVLARENKKLKEELRTLKSTITRTQFERRPIITDWNESTPAWDPEDEVQQKNCIEQ